MKPQVTAVRAHRPDYILALTVFGLLAIGLIMIYSISPVLSHKLLGGSSRNYYFYGQLINIIVGVIAWVAASSINYQTWKRLAPVLIVVAIVALFGLLIPELSFSKNGATRWLKLGFASFQPAELLKLAYIIYLASWFERRGEELKSFWDGVVPFSIMLFAAGIAVVLFQRDFGTMSVLALAAVGMFYVAGMRLRHLAVLAGAGLTLGWLAIVSFPHRVERLTAFLNPSRDLTTTGYHINQALIAVGSGGILGVGLGRSVQVYGYLPEAANDSIFAIIAEEFGLIGSLLVIGLFGLLVVRGLKIAKAAPDPFSRLVAAGITLWLGVQAAINMAAMLSLVPLTGIPLPFISYGGSSLVISLIGAGILLNISKYTVKEGANAYSSQRGRDSWAHFANPGNGRRVKVAR